MREIELDNNLKLEIIFEDSDFLIINKPAGLIVHPLKSLKEKTLVTALLKFYPEIQKIKDTSTGSARINLRPGIVHRLDKEVSGLILVARTQKAFDHFKNEFRNQRIEKEYLALVHGQPKENEQTITLPLIKIKEKTTLAKSADLEKIKESWTEYKVIKRFKNFSLLRIRIKTGRTHQIRIHLKSIGHPIVGDKKYKIKRQKVIDLGRIFLHAYKLGFYDLVGQWREFKIDLPKELKDFLESLKN